MPDPSPGVKGVDCRQTLRDAGYLATLATVCLFSTPRSDKA